MSIFASQVTQVVSYPGAPGSEIVIRKLAPKDLAKAARASQKRALDDLLEVGGTEALKALKAFETERPKTDDDAPSGPVAEPNPLDGYDLGTLVLRGVKSWNFEVPVSAESVDDLDEDALTWLATAVLKLSKPSLFLSAEEREAARKNG